MATIDEPIDRVRGALQNPKYMWRTLRGIAQETGLPLASVRDAIRALGGDIIKSEMPSVTGEELYTTVPHYQERKPKPCDVQKVLEALEDAKYRWRTVKGIAAATGLTEAAVLEVINAKRDAIIQSTIPSTTGEDLYTTRKHYLKKSGPVARMLGFFRGRLA